MIEVLLAAVLGITLFKFVLPTVNTFTKVLEEELKKIDQEGLMKTENAFWSPDQEINTKNN